MNFDYYDSLLSFGGGLQQLVITGSPSKAWRPVCNPVASTGSWLVGEQMLEVTGSQTKTIHLQSKTLSFWNMLAAVLRHGNVYFEGQHSLYLDSAALLKVPLLLGK